MKTSRIEGFVEVEEVADSLLGLYVDYAIARVPNARRRFIYVEILA